MSQCQYVGQALNVTLQSIQKTEGKDQGVFTFLFTPAMPLMNNYNYADYLTFWCNTSNHSVVSWAYSDDKLVLIVDYSTDLEG
jgi:hypothetical protein